MWLTSFEYPRLGIVGDGVGAIGADVGISVFFFVVMGPHIRVIILKLSEDFNDCINAPMRQPWDRIKAQYPEQYVVLVNPQTLANNPVELESGEVVAHNSELDELLNDCNLSQYPHYAIRYTGDLGSAIGERGMIRVIEHD